MVTLQYSIARGEYVVRQPKEAVRLPAGKKTQLKAVRVESVLYPKKRVD